MALRTANIVGSGPNGLAAAVTLALAGVEVTVFERSEQVGGACSTAELTLPGFFNDVGASVFPMGVCSPFLRALPLGDFGLEWIEPDAPLAHPMDDGWAVTLEHSVDDTAAQLGARDGRNYKLLMAPSIRDWPKLVPDFLRGVLHWPRNPVAMATFGVVAMLPAGPLARTVFDGERARALLAGCAAHSVIPLTNLASAATGLVLATAGHTTGWPIVRGGSGALTRALAGYLGSLGGRVELNVDVRALGELPGADVTLFDTSVETMLEVAGERLTPGFRTRAAAFRHGPGVFKIDYALLEPIPWADPVCKRAGTVHVGGTLGEIARSERDAFRGRVNEQPFVLVVQPSLFDPTRAPEGQHTAWAYCHVPFGCTVDYTEIIERQIERFAPGFRDVVWARRIWTPGWLEELNPNLRGGDVAAGAMTLGGMIARPTLRMHRTSDPRLYLASAATPPGGGVHGMCGVLAAEAALRDHAR